jgi:phage FluMu gp28-like protein
VNEPRPGVRYVMALDIGIRRDRTVVAVGHLEASPLGRKVVIDRVQRWTPTTLRRVRLTDEVEPALLGLWRLYHRPKLVYDRTEATSLTEHLSAAGVRCEEFKFSDASVNRLARTLYGVLRDRAITLPNDEVLVAELGSVRLIEKGPGLVKLDHRAGEHDDQAVTVGMVAASLLDGPVGELRLQVAEGNTPKPRQRALLQRKQDGPPVPVVGEGEPSPTDLLMNFQRARRHPGYTGPSANRLP